jgi:hypothetical protein
MSLTPLPELFSHTTSSVIFDPEAVSRVPPQAITLGLDAGKSTLAAFPFGGETPSEEPLSPEAQQTVIPSAPADLKASSKLSRA